MLKIDNVITVTEPNEDILNYIKEQLIIPNPDYLQAIKRNANVRRLRPHMHLYTQKDSNTYVLPFGCLRDIWRLKGDMNYINLLKPLVPNHDYNEVSLYGYQRHAVTLMLKAKNGVLEAPCGSGKTRMGLAIISILKGKALWLTHTKQLMDQSFSSAKELFGDIKYGFITEGKVSIGDDITFATVQTLSKIDLQEIKNEFDVIIIDECHHCVGSPTKVQMFYKVINSLSCRYKFGLSATTTRTDGLHKSMFALIGNVEYSIQSTQIGEKIIKALYQSIENNKKYPMYEYSNTDGTIDYTSLINMLSSDRHRNELITNKVIEMHKEGRKQLILCPRVAQAELIHKSLKLDNVVSLLMTGKKKVSYEVMKQYDTIVATEQLAKEGLDYQELDCLHITSPMKNETTIKQSIGRVERNVIGKKQPIVFDYVDKNISYCVKASKIKRRFALKKI